MRVNETQAAPVRPSAGDGSLVAVFGDRGTGKSYLARKLALADVGPGSLVIYATPNGSNTDPFPGPDRDPADRSSKLPYSVSMRGEDVDDVCQFAIDCASKFRVTLAIDECHESFPEHFSGGARTELFHRGRHYGVRLILISQWPARVDKRIMRASSEIYWFRLHAMEDLWWVERRWGKRAAGDVSRLGKYKYLHVKSDNLPASWRYNPDEMPSPVATRHRGTDSDEP